MDNLIILFFIFVALELFEASWQKSNSIYGIIYNNYQVYKKSIFHFFLFNPTFFYTLFLVNYLNHATTTLYFIAIVKFADILLRLYLVEKLDKENSIEDIFPNNINLNPFYAYINVFAYSTVLFFGLNILEEL